jgi:flagellar protein FliS
MSFQPNARLEYLRNAVMTARPEQLHLMLLDGAIRFTVQGRERLELKDIVGAFNALERAQKIVLELKAGLNRDANPQIVDQMISLYNFIFNRLVDANFHHELGAADDALAILRHQRDTWALIVERVTRDTDKAIPVAAPTGPRASESEPQFSIQV